MRLVFNSPFSHLFTFLFILTGSAFAQTIPAPEETLGFKIGADFHLATYTQSIEYLKKLDEASENLTLVKVGYTSEGQEWMFAMISSKENLAQVEKYKEITRKLAHPGNMTPEEAKKLSLEGKPIVHIDGGLHATEVAGPQHTTALVHYILSNTNDPKIKNILDNVILMLWPTINPDGQNMVANWYMSNVGTPYEIAPLPKLYQKYVGHDNNRDAYMLNMIESRVVERTWREWEPNIIHVHHQTAPFPTRIWLPPFAEPIASQSPAIIAREVNMIGMAMAQALELNNQPGATHMGTGFDAWYPGYVDYLPVLQNTPSFWTETALYRYATPHFYTVDDFPKDKTDLRSESLYNSAWKGGWWHMSDAMAYMQTASLAVLDYAAKYGDVLLYSRYQAANETIKKYKEEPPYAYFIPQDQRDPVSAVELLRRLAFNGVKVGQLDKPVIVDGISYDKGTWVIPMDQEYAELVRQVFDRQTYPDLREYPGGPPEQPYDAAGWTMPLQFGTKVVAAASPLSDEVHSAIKPVKGNATQWQTAGDKDAYPTDFAPGVGFNTNEVAAGIVAPAGRITGSGSSLAVDPKENNAFRLVNEAMKAGGSVKYANGKYIISGVSRALLDKWVKEYSINAQLTGSSGVAVRSRIALYRPWRPSMDEGWTRWLFECFGFPFTNIRNSDFAAGDLRKRFDVIVLASDRPSIIKHGFKNGTISPQYAGGLEEPGVRSLEEFVRQGGTLVCLNESSDFAIEELHLPVKNVVKGLDRKDYFTGGSILEVETNTNHPVMAGMPERANVFVDDSPVFTTTEGFEGVTLAKFSKYGSPLQSGYLSGEKYVQGYAASLDVKYGNGHVVLIGFRPQWRGQPYGTFKVLFNAVLYGGELAASQKNDTTFWSAPKQKTEEPSK